MADILDKNFYNRYTPEVTKDLLGCRLAREVDGEIYKGMITEAECYRGFHDLASHASRAKTKRNKVMFGEPGRVYVYLIYGMYWMLNVVTEKEGYPAAVLIRGVEMVDKSGNKTKKLDGPGKLTRDFGIAKDLNEWDLTLGEKLWIEENKSLRKKKIIKKPRVGVDYAGRCRKWKWNFSLKF
ncbi:MAG: DNA-3-methyladenine glycosylase [Candidatus Moraniibacteriota bacterium]